MQNSQNNWQVKTQGKIYEADYEELKQWIAEGAVLLSDQVKRGNLRWLSIERVPELAAIVNSNDLIASNGVSSAEEVIETQTAFENSAQEIDSETIVEKICLSHADAAVAFTCDNCKKFFCKICPTSFSGTIKLCPLCAALSTNRRKRTVQSAQSINLTQKPRLSPAVLKNKIETNCKIQIFRTPLFTLQSNFIVSSKRN